MKDYYYILGLNRNASKDEIKKSFRKLSLKFHPDQNNGDKFFEERFKDIHEAYETLVDEVKRKLYDNTLSGNTNANTSEKNYSGTSSTQSPQSKGKEEPGSPNTPPPRSSASSISKKKKSNEVLYIIIGTIIFLTPFILKQVVNSLDKKDNTENYSDTSQNKASQNASNDTTSFLTTRDTTTTTTPSAPPVSSNPSPASSDSGTAATISQKEMSRLLNNKDGDSLTAKDAVNYFFQALDDSDCNTAWNMCYNTNWINSGKDWFCSNNAFGGVRKVIVRNMYPLVLNTDEAELYFDYYAEDIYNGNKCFKQNIRVQKIYYTDNKFRWKITRMDNIETPVACDENQHGNSQ